MKVMRQYEHTFKNFIFIGPSPIDYDTRKLFGTCVWEELCNFNLNEYIKKKKDKIGIIFNLSPSSETALLLPDSSAIRD